MRGLLDDVAGATCSPLDDGTASWTLTPTGTSNVAGTCDAGYTQTNSQPPTRNCNADLSWGTVVNACTRALPIRVPPLRVSEAHRDGSRRTHWFGLSLELTCPDATDATTHAFFNMTLSGTLVSGVCLPGFAPGATPPSRTCLLTGVWSDVTGTCNRAFFRSLRPLPPFRPGLTPVAFGFGGRAARPGRALLSCGQHRLQRQLADWRQCRVGGVRRVLRTWLDWKHQPRVPHYRPVGRLRHWRLHAYEWLRIAHADAKSATSRPCGPPVLVVVRRHTEIFCLPTASGEVDGHASWPITATSSSPVSVTSTACDETYTGSARRVCNPDGSWGTIASPCICMSATARTRPPTRGACEPIRANTCAYHFVPFTQ